MLRSILTLAVLSVISAPAGAALVTINESGDFGGTNANKTASTNIGTITDSPVELIGIINGSADNIDAWTFTIPAGRTLTAINVTASGFDGSNDFVDLYTNTAIDPDAPGNIGDLLTAALVVGNHPLSVGPGTYKLSALSTETKGYTIQIVSVPEPSAVAAVGLLAAGMLARRRRA